MLAGYVEQIVHLGQATQITLLSHLIASSVAIRKQEIIYSFLAISLPKFGPKLPMLLVKISIRSWDLLISWGGKLKRKSLKYTICKLDWQASVYHLWLEKNSRIHSQVPKDSDTIYGMILQVLKFKLLSLPSSTIQSIDPGIASSLGIRSTI